jgi:hypothetical protein
MKLAKIASMLLIIGLGTDSRACPEESVTIGPYHVQTIKGTIEPYDGSNYEELTITFVVKERDTEKTWSVPVHRNGEFLLVVPKGEYNFTIRVEQFLFTITGKIVVDDEGKTTPILIRPPWC